MCMKAGILETENNKGTKLTGIPFGFAKLDEITGGFQKSDLIVVASRPGMGKTAFALNIIGDKLLEE